jgi:nucleoside 2-deoxyribosyltransferase
MAKKTIVVCTSAAFYKHANEIAEELKGLGFSVIVPSTAERMQKENNYSVKRIKTWYDRPEDARLKHNLAMEHFKKVAAGDAVLIINDHKPNQPTYIGPNTMMEWGLAYYLKKPVFLLNRVGRDHNAYEEMISMTTEVLEGNLSKIKL